MAELTEEQDDIGVTRWSVIMSDPATNRETGLRIYHGEDELHARSVHACVAALEAENDRLREAMKVTEADRNAARESLAQELRSVLGERGLWTPKGRASDLILAFSKAIDDLHAKLEAAETREVAILKRNREQAERLTAAEAERHRLREFVGDVKADGDDTEVGCIETYILQLREARIQWLEQMRGIESRCSRCDGFGCRAYGSTTTWRGGIGGQAITGGVCDKCWGSGDESRPWMNLRRLEGERRKERADLEAALQWKSGVCDAAFADVAKVIAWKKEGDEPPPPDSPWFKRICAVCESNAALRAKLEAADDE